MTAWQTALYVALLSGSALCACGTSTVDAQDGRAVTLDGGVDLDAGEGVPVDGGARDAGVNRDGGCIARRDDGCPSDAPLGFLPVCAQDCTAFPNLSSCLYAAAQVRCRCSFGWVCESAQCPATPPIAGQPCDAPNLNCGRAFEVPGLVCVSPENLWVGCTRLRTDQVLNGTACPPNAPPLGATCCLIFPSGAPDTCRYDGGALRCAGYHWRAAGP